MVGAAEVNLFGIELLLSPPPLPPLLTSSRAFSFACGASVCSVESSPETTALGVKRASDPATAPLLRELLKRWLNWRRLLLASLLVGDRRPEEDGGGDTRGCVRDAKFCRRWSKFGAGSLGGDAGFFGCKEEEDERPAAPSLAFAAWIVCDGSGAGGGEVRASRAALEKLRKSASRARPVPRSLESALSADVFDVACTPTSL